MTYSITDLLDGKYYRSRSLARRNKDGIIVWAEKREDICNHNDEIAYLVKVRPIIQIPNPFALDSDFYATVFVKVEN